MVQLKKFAFYSVLDDADFSIEKYQQKNKDLAAKMDIVQCRIYLQEVEGKKYLFHFFESEHEISFLGEQAKHVYEFRLHEGDDLSGLKSKGMIIGVQEGMLNEYIRLHDEQPQIIHDLCYQNGFRKSSIFTFPVISEHYYLLQFVEFKGQENPELYQDETYQEWLRVTGKCQKPLPGEQFWKDMQLIYSYRSDTN